MNNKPVRQEDTIDLLELAKILLHRWIIILVVTVLTGAACFGFFHFTTDTSYSATIKMYVNADALSVSSSISVSTLNASSSLVPIYKEIVNTHLVLDKVGKLLNNEGYSGIDYYYLTENKMIECSALNNTPVFQIKVTDTDPERAIEIANTIAKVLPTEIANIIDGSSARIVDSALSAERLSRGVLKNSAIGAMLAFVIMCFIIIMNDYFLNDSISDVKYLEETFPDIPVLGNIPKAQARDRKEANSDEKE
ncbi:MAG: Wzz/FepE/Etk N-terminal domain-containing protein [Solobacterium sp.]|nr:Wzz/FepE/Etk N-terminal domain-containing protein [Solobacterium sp.]MDY4640217.1 Wzz/FepE/Etk N-terminal domain-containing protein [Erysipelotrichaceae bacterium]